MIDLAGVPADRPVLIAGPTGSGKSALALQIAERQGGTVINADALQVFALWRVLTARPTPEDEARAPHALYGHVTDNNYSTGQWLRDVVPLLSGPSRPIIVGGTGLYFSALTEGLAAIPATPPDIRATADALTLEALLAGLDPESAAILDQRNRARVQRAWEVLQATGRGIAAWHAETPAPVLPPETATRLLVDAPPAVLTPRLAQRFAAMLANGALDEVRAVLPDWNPALPAHRAIGAPELVAHLRGEITLSEAEEAAVVATRRYAKRQRTWFRARMRDWRVIPALSTG
ncbi:MAG: tRNA (adenosine(37)-N6)-dimethylallyltransferase MiaA [Limimaricola sp.]|uniref:tRNA (adenosine(37)-N6)-dimethylallyltransferase MiaA n=1 Tax=Limimaricola sp. TaxID=2211665 RepID=UPI001D23C9B0|nr:tRNA (adenosine(37)-N6)-dimethylallyltransferase MiaA [Limimaricola sp.]MBI1418007.1 tRNA (adenosine(37)-N6)-dimethylallyltransferase MiaA [Limimaricola sp.]